LGLLWTLRRERFFEPADDGRLNRGGRRPHELAHLLELGHDGLALYAELLREFVYPDLRHCAPSARSGIAGPIGPARARSSGRRQILLFIAAFSSGAHHNRILLSRL